MKLRMAGVLAAVLAATVACGSDDSAAGEPGLPASTPAPTASTTATETTPAASSDAGAATTSTPATSTEPTSSSDATAPDASGCRPVTHVLGTVCVPADPRRIVVLDPSTALPTLLRLGAPVVGTITAFEGSRLPDYLDPQETAGIEIVGSAYGANLEAIAALDPDLIVGWQTVIEPVREELERIAPVVATTFAIYDPNWRAQALLVADLVGGRTELEADLAAIDDRKTALAAELAAAGGGLELSRVDSYRDMLLAYRWPCTWLGDELDDVGLTLPAALAGDCTPGDQRTLTVQVSGELLEMVDADAILVFKSNLTGVEMLDPLPDFEANPIWPTLDAVRNGRAVAVGDAWGQGADVLALQQVLDDVERIFG